MCQLWHWHKIEIAIHLQSLDSCNSLFPWWTSSFPAEKWRTSWQSSHQCPIWWTLGAQAQVAVELDTTFYSPHTSKLVSGPEKGFCNIEILICAAHKDEHDLNTHVSWLVARNHTTIEWREIVDYIADVVELIIDWERNVGSIFVAHKFEPFLVCACTRRPWSTPSDAKRKKQKHVHLFIFWFADKRSR